MLFCKISRWHTALKAICPALLRTSLSDVITHAQHVGMSLAGGCCRKQLHVPLVEMFPMICTDKGLQTPDIQNSEERLITLHTE